MEHSQLNTGSAHDTDPVTVCPSCGANAYLAGAIRDIRTSETYRVFDCGCGRVIWNRLQSVPDREDQQHDEHGEQQGNSEEIAKDFDPA